MPILLLKRWKADALHRKGVTWTIFAGWIISLCRLWLWLLIWWRIRFHNAMQVRNILRMNWYCLFWWVFVDSYPDIMTEVDDGDVMLVLQLLMLLQTSTDDLDGGVAGSINVDTQDGLSASGSGFIAGNITEVDRLIGIPHPIDCWSLLPFSKILWALYSFCCAIVLMVPVNKIIMVHFHVSNRICEIKKSLTFACI